jgi:1-acyl-sn-glycerol-3-phosphate acyltransferase
MIKKVIAFIVHFIFLIATSQTVVLNSVFIGKSKEGGQLITNLIIRMSIFFYIHLFDSRIFYKGEYKKTDKIDIIISNHINTLDYTINAGIIREFDDRNTYVLMKKSEMFTPGLGFTLTQSEYIFLNRKLEDDIDNISKSIKKINEGVIVIMPEGTRYTEEKRQLAEQYSKDNNLPVFKNTLFPKMKGLWVIINELKKQNKLGNIIDFTIKLDKLDKNAGPNIYQFITEEMGNSYGIINNYEIPLDKIENYDMFKKWFLNKIWKKKDKVLTNFNKTIKKSNFKEVNSSLKPHVYMLVIIIMCWFFYLVKKTNYLYLLFGFLVSYIIVYYKYRKISN